MARRLKTCNSCRRRFCTASGSTQCLDCRAKSLTYNGKPMPKLSSSGKSQSSIRKSSSVSSAPNQDGANVAGSNFVPACDDVGNVGNSSSNDSSNGQMTSDSDIMDVQIKFEARKEAGSSANLLPPQSNCGRLVLSQPGEANHKSLAQNDENEVMLESSPTPTLNEPAAYPNDRKRKFHQQSGITNEEPSEIRDDSLKQRKSLDSISILDSDDEEGSTTENGNRFGHHKSNENEGNELQNDSQINGFSCRGKKQRTASQDLNKPRYEAAENDDNEKEQITPTSIRQSSPLKQQVEGCTDDRGSLGESYSETNFSVEPNALADSKNDNDPKSMHSQQNSVVVDLVDVADSPMKIQICDENGPHSANNLCEGDRLSEGIDSAKGTQHNSDQSCTDLEIDMTGHGDDDYDDDDCGQRINGTHKVSFGSTIRTASESDSRSEESELDKWIDRDSLWGTKTKGVESEEHDDNLRCSNRGHNCDGTAEGAHVNGNPGSIVQDSDGNDDENGDNDDDSEIECLGTTPAKQSLSGGGPSTLKMDPQDFSEDDFFKVNENNDHTFTSPPSKQPQPSKLGTDHIDVSSNLQENLSSVSNTSTKTEIENHASHWDDDTYSDAKPEHVSPKKDVCYICGSDLSRITTGVKGRVAHMKRCSAKYGKVLGVARSNDGDFSSDFIESGAAEVATPSNPKQQEFGGSKESSVTNPYRKDQWHGNSCSESNASQSLTAGINRQSELMESPQKHQKQTVLKSFFQAPIRNASKVLMAGARRLAKGAEVAAPKKKEPPNPKGGNQSYRRRGRWTPNRNANCPAYKKIPGTDFVCDGFLYARRTLTQNYFLTHFHSDHYGGITKQWSEGIIYCSLPTANLVNQQLGVEKRHLHPLPMNTPTVINSLDKPITVTLLDANHCPGAVMLLFEVGNRKILHVGDFRWDRNLMLKMPQLNAFCNLTKRLDELFLDTTYCDPKYSLPTQADAIQAAIEVAERELATAKKEMTKVLFLFGSYTIGKERIYLSVAQHLKAKVYVDSRRYKILSALEWPKERMQIFTTNKSESFLWVVPLGHVNFKRMRNYMEDGNKNKVFTTPYGRVAGFRPTGWTYSPSGNDLISSKTSGRYSVHGVPYSEHSSFPELVDCLACLKPKKIVTTVSPSKSDEQCKLLLDAVRMAS